MNVPSEIQQETTGVYFSVFVVSEKYTRFLMILRYTFLALSILMGVFYLIFFIRIPPLARTFEHKAIAILSVLLIFFNDPFYYLTIYKVSKYLAVLSSLQVIVFLSFLIFFWAVMLQRIHKEKVSLDTLLINKYSIGVGLVTFTLYMIVGVIGSLAVRWDPGFHARQDYPTVYDAFLIILIVYAVSLLLGFLYNSFQIFKEWNKIIQRHRIFYYLSIYFIISLFLITLTGLFNSYETSGVRILLLIFLGNFYIFMLQILWRFAPQGRKEFDEVVKSHVMSSKSEQERN